MAEVVNMPRLSDTMEEGTVAKWHKKVGDKVSEGDLLAEIETDKATMDFEAFQEGVLLHIGVEEGDTALVDSILAILGEKDEDISDLLEGGGEKKDSGKKEEAKEESESKSSNKEDDDEVSDDKEDADAKEEAEADSKKAKKEKDTEVDDEEAKSSEKTVSDSDGRIKASPLAKKMAEDKGFELSKIKGSGDGGRIVKEDVENYTPQKETTSASSSAGASSEEFEEVKISQMRKTIAKRLAESKFTAPHFYLTLDIDMDGAIAARKSMNEIAETKISFNDLVVKAAAVALKKHPSVNSAWMGDKIRMNKHIHIGVAVAVDEGLVVPVIKNADQKGLSDINKMVKSFAEQARNKKLPPSDMEGGTFAISNLGMFGIEEFTAIINPPNSCILAVGAIKQVPVVKDGLIVPGNVMRVTLSCDHRTVDGASGAAFLQTFKGVIENPLNMLI